MDTLKKLAAIIALALLGLVPVLAQEESREAREEARDEAEQEGRLAIEGQIREYERQVAEAARKIAELHGRLSRLDPRVLSRVESTLARPVLGLVVRTEVDEESDAIGATLQAVTPGSPAEEAGLRPGDVITSINGKPIGGAGPDDEEEDDSPAAVRLIDLARGLREGEKVALDYRRGRETRSVTLEARRLSHRVHAPVNVEIDTETLKRLYAGIPPVAPVAVLGRWLDVELVTLNRDLGQYFKADRGVLVVRTPEEEDLKIRGGDVIVKIAGAEVETPMQAVRLLRVSKPGKPIVMQVIRKGDLITLTAEAPQPSRAPRVLRPPRHPAPAPPQPPEDEEPDAD